MCTENKITEAVEAEDAVVAETAEVAEDTVIALPAAAAVEAAEAEVTEVAEENVVAEETVIALPAAAAVEEAAVEDEEDEPIIIRFPDEDEEYEPVVVSIPEEEATVADEEEKYVPKAVAFAATPLFAEKKKDVKEQKKDPYLERAKKVRDFTADMIYKGLFNAGTFFSIGFFSASFVYITLYTLVFEFCRDVMGMDFNGLFISAGNTDKAIGSAMLGILAILIQIIMGVLLFVGFRVAQGSARNNGGNMSTAGLSIARIALIFMIVTTVLVFVIDICVMSIVIAALNILHLIFGIKCISKLRKAIAYADAEKLSPTFALLGFALIPAYILSFKEYFTIETFKNTDEKIYFFALGLGFIFAAVSLLLMGIFVFVYNAKLKKFKKALDTE